MQSQQGRSAPRTPHAPCNMIPVYRTLKELKESSPSRKHGLSEEDEERWRRAAINLMVNAAVKINMQVLDHTALCTAIGFFHRYYAEHSMVTNDRFLMAMACLYLGGKIADFPKSSRDIIFGCVSTMCETDEESSRLRNNNEWMKQTRQAINDAERALLYQVGFRFSWETTITAVFRILQDMTNEVGVMGIGAFLNLAYYKGIPPNEKPELTNLSFLLANESIKVPLTLQYPTEAIAAVCVWMGMKMFKVPGSPTNVVNEKGQSKKWYYKYGLEAEDVEIIAQQITEAVVGDAEAWKEITSEAAKVIKTELIMPSNGV